MLKSKKPLSTELSKLLDPVDMKDSKYWKKTGDLFGVEEAPDSDLKLKRKKKFVEILPISKAPVGTEVKIKTTRVTQTNRSLNILRARVFGLMVKFSEKVLVELCGFCGKEMNFQ